jgi:fucose 4-O-acetylase-like acetyltransferase
MSKVGKIAQVVGCNTLGIYLLHYFFLWGGYDFISSFYATHPTPLMMFVIYVIVAILILVASMLLISVVKVSPLLSKLILGKK